MNHITPASDTARSMKMLEAMADMGGAGVALAFAQAFGLVPEATPEQQRQQDAPLVVYESPWKDSLPDWLRKAVPEERARIQLGMHPGWIVGPAEIAAVMYPAVMEAPLREDANQLYLWACTNARAWYDRKPAIEVWMQAGVPIVYDADVVDAGGRYHQAYRRLCEEIVATRERHAPRRRPAAKKPAPAAPAAAEAPQRGLFG